MRNGSNPPATANIVGENVRAARRYRGMSLEVAAGLAGRSKAWLSKVENGHTRLERRSDIAALAAALDVSAADLLAEPTTVIRPQDPAYGDAVRLREVLLNSSLTDPMDVQARPLSALHDLLLGPIQEMRRQADDARLTVALPPLLGELHVHVTQGDDRERAAALALLIDACTAATFTLRNLAQVDLAWIAADRAQSAAALLGGPVEAGAAAFAAAHSRSAASLNLALRHAGRYAAAVEPTLTQGARRPFEVYGMLHLSAALACQVQTDFVTAREHLAEAQRVAQRVGERKDAWQWFGPANTGVWHATLAVEGGEPEEALKVAGGVHEGALTTGRRAALRIESGRALAMLGRDREAVQQLREAERLSVTRVHTNPLVRGLVADLHDRATGRDLRGLAWRMNLI